MHTERTPPIQIKPPLQIHQPKKINKEEGLLRMQESIKKFGHSLKKRQIVILVLVFFLSFVVYGIGFVLRTEYTIRTLIAIPQTSFSIENIQKTTSTLWRDYQILWLVADNSPIPLEPLTSYGKILRNIRILLSQNKNIQKMADDILNWKTVAQTQSIFPLLNKMWEVAEEGRDSVSTISTSLFSVIPPRPGLIDKYEKYNTYLTSFLRHKEIWYDLLGKNGPTKILILNQNNDELRAGGWFPGTVFLIEFEDGKIKNIAFHDIYELDHSMTGWYIEPPEGINQFNSLKYPGKPVEFRIRDANYYPTFAESARKINELTSLSKIGPVDLVIGINTSLLSDIIELTGPLEVSGIPLKLDKDTISLVLSMVIEAKEKIHWIPKGIIQVLWNTLLDIVVKKKITMDLLSVLWKNMENGEISVASPNENTQKAIDDLHLFDLWKESKTDFIYPIFTSVGRNKSDRIMQRQIIIERKNDCTREVVLEQKHTWNIWMEAQIKKMAHDLDIDDRIPLLLPVQWNSPNRQYLRIVLPKWSTAKSVWKVIFDTIETTQEETILAGYTNTPTSGSSTLKFQYTVPENLCNTDTHFYKQAGLKNLTVIAKNENSVISQKKY